MVLHSGTTLWDAEIVLSYFVESENIKGSVVELGCGTALASMVCSRLGCQVAVQELPEVLESTKCVLAANSVSVSHAFGVTWGPEFVSVLKTTGMCNYFDNIIMADVLYHCEDFEDLIVSILHCSAVKCRLYVCFEQRRRNLDAFFSSVELYFDRTSCIKHSIRNEESGRITIIYAMKFETRNNLGFLSQEA